jgi:nitroimidazol reductase NimA-like FMN-containing flavoprotein (pyridoxamine 5'-phosphate oxidase superfamily)
MTFGPTATVDSRQQFAMTSERLDRSDVELEILDRATCLHLLGSRSVGRIALNRRGQGPLVLPVNYGVEPAGTLIFRTDLGTKLTRATVGAVGFQVDDLDEGTFTGWSILVDGLAYEADLAEAFQVEVQPWAPGRKPHAVRLVPTCITGRRLVESGPGGDPCS